MDVQSSQQSGDTMGRCNGDGSISVILSDPDVLDCPICLEPLIIPVFQCENGHVACNCCCSKLKNRCASCCLPIGYNRCRAMEKVIESVKISCQNVKYGCKETVSYTKKHDHEHVCLQAPCSCPHTDCSFVGSSKKLYQHFSSKHSSFATRFSYDKVFSVALIRGLRHVILQERYEGVIFIINCAREDLGTLVNVNCIGPSTTKRGFSYELTAKSGETSVVLHSITESAPNWVEHSPQKAFLVVPREFDSSVRGDSVRFKLEVCIRRPKNPSGI